jgi:excisionase family DNA binding protein
MASCAAVISASSSSLMFMRSFRLRTVVVMLVLLLWCWPFSLGDEYIVPITTLLNISKITYLVPLAAPYNIMGVMNLDSLNGEYLTTPEASALSHKGESFIKRLCRDGRLSGAKKLGKTWLIPREALENYVPMKRGPRTKKEKLSGELAGICKELKNSKGRNDE